MTHGSGEAAHTRLAHGPGMAAHTRLIHGPGVAGIHGVQEVADSLQCLGGVADLPDKPSSWSTMLVR